MRNECVLFDKSENGSGLGFMPFPWRFSTISLDGMRSMVTCSSLGRFSRGDVSWMIMLLYLMPDHQV